VTRPGALLVLCSVLGAACAPGPERSDDSTEAYLRLLAAEDARPADGPELDLLVVATGDPDPFLRRTAVRALGRLENPVLVDEISARVDDVDPGVRVAAALALAQAVHDPEAVGADGDDSGDDAEGRGELDVSPTSRVLDALLARAAVEADPLARGALGRSLGRLRLAPPARERALQALLALSRPGGSTPAPASAPPSAGDAAASSSAAGNAPAETLVGVALGLESLVRASPDEGLGVEAADRLEELLSYRRDAEDDVDAARVRALAMAALGAARRLSLELVAFGLADPDAEVRRVAIREIDVVVPSRRPELLRQALGDRSVRVAIEAARAIAAGSRSAASCADLVEAAGPDSPLPLRVAALSALSAPCPGTEQGGTLRAAAAELDETSPTWQPAAQALGSLTRIDPGAARRLLPRYVYHPSPFVRSHAAGAAAALQEDDALYALAADASPIVRTAAIDGLFALEGHTIDDLLREQLASDDPELLLTAAGLLAGSPQARETGTAALAAFERISAARRETWRDPRIALLERVDEAGDGSSAPRLRPYLADYDPLVARRVAAILDGWFGQPHEVAPEPLPRAPLPTAAELDELERTTVVLYVRDLGEIVIEPLPDVAPTNAWRFVRLALEGYYDGLTLHRWAPNFVIQGGSPGANEYAGDGPYSRDEIGLSHWRGTVGLSTRGRDTGDGQLFINLSDNVALDPDYTVFAVVTEGLDVVESVLEGALIERVEVREGF
jgi:cyclophilin family peptidyl-prolyl cis-trans isomerase